MGTTLHLEWPTTLLGCLAIIVTAPIYIFYWKGPTIREKSKFAQVLASDRKAKGEMAVRCGSDVEGAEAVYLSGMSRSGHFGTPRGSEPADGAGSRSERTGRSTAR